IKWLSVFSVGAERAVMMTVAPPRRKRSAIALPAPFVPPVTKTRLPVNSFVSGVFFDDAVILNHTLRVYLLAVTQGERFQLFPANSKYCDCSRLVTPIS